LVHSCCASAGSHGCINDSLTSRPASTRQSNLRPFTNSFISNACASSMHSESGATSAEAFGPNVGWPPAAWLAAGNNSPTLSRKLPGLSPLKFWERLSVFKAGECREDSGFSSLVKAADVRVKSLRLFGGAEGRRRYHSTPIHWSRENQAKPCCPSRK